MVTPAGDPARGKHRCCRFAVQKQQEPSCRNAPGCAHLAANIPALAFPKGSGIPRGSCGAEPSLAAPGSGQDAGAGNSCCNRVSLGGSPRSQGGWVKLLFPSRRSCERGEEAGHVGGAEGGGRGRAEGV